MKLITRDTDYAVRALCYIAKNKRRIIPVPELVKELKIPRPFLRKILQLLHKNRILASHKGKNGGFLLAKPAAKIYITDLMEIFQGPLKINECVFKKKQCPNKGACCLRDKIIGIEKRVIAELKSITLGELANGKEKNY